MIRRLALTVAAGLALALSACGAPAAPTDAGAGGGAAAAGAELRLPPGDAAPDYQLGGSAEPDPAVTLVARDRTAAPDPDRYSICYVNGFQTQPGELDAWPAETLLRDPAGEPVIDPAWPDEILLDTGTAAQRAQIAAVVTPWITGCADAGFDAVEFDNLDSYTRSDGALSLPDNLALATDLVAAAHGVGLAAGQKNAVEDAATLRAQAGFDFAVTETCAAYRECGGYRAVYGERVIDIEYTDLLPRTFAEMCADADSPAAMVLRDRALATPDDPGYVFELCGSRD
ncbi:endo alpha-1,4 polygalactosaminidase [Leucobacter luti]|uniref:Glycoside-hydrolase family GH114 TIM-barrel domain-containing protein n=1 Tax=Leucobacter luti TaxID=340320 RepID=A0A4Q7U493_9MICO|nr:endo alpha-1,4 polygalactosaminidase [Leucobacter luti]MBL3699636.1 hypothetical protein [Leucobacter luti]RZT67148.1 hypothetical protein EV139_1283 [Leucobacter luti]